jgi:hypothetical protein
VHVQGKDLQLIDWLGSQETLYGQRGGLVAKLFPIPVDEFCLYLERPGRPNERCFNNLARFVKIDTMLTILSGVDLLHRRKQSPQGAECCNPVGSSSR